MTGAAVDTLRLIHGVMDSASGFSHATVLLPSMSARVDTTKCATANSAQMHHSATALIVSGCVGLTSIIADSGDSGAWLPSGSALLIG